MLLLKGDILQEKATKMQVFFIKILNGYGVVVKAQGQGYGISSLADPKSVSHNCILFKTNHTQISRSHRETLLNR